MDIPPPSRIWTQPPRHKVIPFLHSVTYPHGAPQANKTGHITYTPATLLSTCGLEHMLATYQCARAHQPVIGDQATATGLNFEDMCDKVMILLTIMHTVTTASPVNLIGEGEVCMTSIPCPCSSNLFQNRASVFKQLNKCTARPCGSTSKTRRVAIGIGSSTGNVSPAQARATHRIADGGMAEVARAYTNECGGHTLATPARTSSATEGLTATASPSRATQPSSASASHENVQRQAQHATPSKIPIRNQCGISNKSREQFAPQLAPVRQQTGSPRQFNLALNRAGRMDHSAPGPSGPF